MSDIGNFIVKSIEEIKSDVKNIYARLEAITKDLHNYKSQKYKCQAECDRKYFKQGDVENVFKRELDRYYEQRDKATHMKTSILKNVIEIVTALAPYAAIAGTYFVLTQ